MRSARGLVLVTALALATPAQAGPSLAQKLSSTARRAGDAAHFLDMALRPIPGALASGFSKRWHGATTLNALLHDDLSKLSPAALAEKARPLLLANPKQRILRSADLRTALHRVLGAYGNDPAKTDLLLSRMILTPQNTPHAARRLGSDAVRTIEEKFAAVRIDARLPEAQRVAELKHRLELDNGAAKPGVLTVYKTGISIQRAMLAQLHKARDAARRGKPAHYAFSTYALEDDTHPVGAAFATALREAADAGVEIVGLYDRTGSWHSGVRNEDSDLGFYGRLNSHRSPDGKTRIQLVPIAESPLMAHGSHQKWSVSTYGDHGDAMVSDANIGTLYQGKGAHWQGTATKIEGPAVADIGEMAVARLRGNGYVVNEKMRKALTTPRALPPGREAGETTVIDHVAGRDLKNKRLVLNAIDSATRGDSVEWSQPYGHDHDVNDALVAAGQRGADVHVVYARKNTVWTAAAAERDSYGRLLAAGVKIHEYGLGDGKIADVAPTTQVFSHAKVLVVRYKSGAGMMAVGSSNGDNRSFGDVHALGILTGNDESLAVTFDKRRVDETERTFMHPQLTDHSVPVLVAQKRTLAVRALSWLLERMRGLN